MWQTKTLQKHDSLLSGRFLILFNQIMRLKELQIRKQNNHIYQYKVHELIKSTLYDLQKESNRLNISWFNVLTEFEKQSLK